MRFVVLLLLFPSLAFTLPHHDIPTKEQVRNGGVGYCMWASLVTIAHSKGIRSLDDLIDKHRDDKYGATFFEVEFELTRRGVKYDSQWFSTVEWMRKHTDKGNPILTGFLPWSYMKAHAVAVVDIDDESVFFVDSNHPGDLYKYSIDDFKEGWQGWALALEKPND